MELIISAKGKMYTIQDKEKGRNLYSVKKKGFGNNIRYVLLDASNYNLYSLVQTGDNVNPTFIITHNGSSIIQLSCKSRFYNPTIMIQGKDLSKNVINYTLTSKDQKTFDIVKGDEERIGGITTNFTVSEELQYELEISDKVFDDYIPLFVVAVDMIFSEYNLYNFKEGTEKK